MEQQQDVFKVVRTEDERYVSAIETGACKLEYLPNVVTKPKRGKIFAFSTLEFAKEFVEEEETMLSTHEVWKAKGKNPKVIGQICLYPKDDGKFWKNLLIEDMHLGDAPEGTIVVDEIKLLERAD